MFYTKFNLDLMEGARNLARIMNVKGGEKVIIVCDTFADPLVIEAFRMAVLEKEAEPTICITPPLRHQGGDPSEITMAAIEKADVIYGCTTLSLAHGIAIMRARINNGARYSTVSTLTAPELASEGARFPSEIVDAIVNSIYRKGGKLIKERNVRVTDEKGTDVVSDLEGAEGSEFIGTTPDRKGGKYGPGVPPGQRSGFPLGTIGLHPGDLTEPPAELDISIW